jgi:CHAT domain-containing protein
MWPALASNLTTRPKALTLRYKGICVNATLETFERILKDSHYKKTRDRAAHACRTTAARGPVFWAGFSLIGEPD